VPLPTGNGHGNGHVAIEGDGHDEGDGHGNGHAAVSSGSPGHGESGQPGGEGH
jgi:hypothetical protein